MAVTLPPVSPAGRGRLQSGATELLPRFPPPAAKTEAKFRPASRDPPSAASSPQTHTQHRGHTAVTPTLRAASCSHDCARPGAPGRNPPAPEALGAPPPPHPWFPVRRDRPFPHDPASHPDSVEYHRPQALGAMVLPANLQDPEGPRQYSVVWAAPQRCHHSWHRRLTKQFPSAEFNSQARTVSSVPASTFVSRNLGCSFIPDNFFFFCLLSF